jgi:hypothetical protein
MATAPDHRSRRCSLLVAAVLAAGCNRHWVCGELAASTTAALPARLSETGLYADIATGELALAWCPSRRASRCGATAPRSSAGSGCPTVGQLDAPVSTPTYRTVVGQAVKPGAPEGSRLYELVSARGMFRQMPPLATEKVDTSAVAAIRLWIEGL